MLLEMLGVVENEVLKINGETEAQELAVGTYLFQRCSWGKWRAEIAPSFLPPVSSQKHDTKRMKISYFIQTSSLKAPWKAP